MQADFPHDLAIEVLERRPVAALDIHGRRVPVSGGGVVLTGVEADRGLPSIRRDDSPTDGRVEDLRTRAAVAVAAAAPAELLARSDRLWWGPKGLTADLRDGPPLVFGSADDAGRQVGRGRARAGRGERGRCHLSRPPRARSRGRRRHRSGASGTAPG